MEPQSGIKTWQWVVTILVVIALIVIGIMVFRNKEAAPSNTGIGANTSPTPTSVVGANSVIISDQFPGDIVHISSVQLTQPGWIAIHEDLNGQPGDIIGSARFQAGVSPGSIKLSKSTVDGRTYYAMVHTDDGDGTFDPTKDAALRDTNGNMVMRTFKASSSADAEIKG